MSLAGLTVRILGIILENNVPLRTRLGRKAVIFLHTTKKKKENEWPKQIAVCNNR